MLHTKSFLFIFPFLFPYGLRDVEGFGRSYACGSAHYCRITWLPKVENFLRTDGALFAQLFCILSLLPIALTVSFMTFSCLRSVGKRGRKGVRNVVALSVMGVAATCVVALIVLSGVRCSCLQGSVCCPMT